MKVVPNKSTAELTFRYLKAAWLELIVWVNDSMFSICKTIIWHYTNFCGTYRPWWSWTCIQGCWINSQVSQSSVVRTICLGEWFKDSLTRAYLILDCFNKLVDAMIQWLIKGDTCFVTEWLSLNKSVESMIQWLTPKESHWMNQWFEQTG